ncbi:MAG TPA: serine hydrolase [Candidatus Saccharimonadales bacterium]|nr:serine hydrolase [Candidatus Saccharimonadales bacterium]
MYTSYAGNKPRHYYLYAQKTKRRVWPLFAMLLLTCALTVPAFKIGEQLSKTRQSAAINTTAVPVPAATQPNQIEPQQDTTQGLTTSDYLTLQQQIKDWSAHQKKGQWSIVVQDLNNNANRAVVNPDVTYNSASLYKLFLTIPLAQKVTFDKWATTKTLANSSKTYGECVTAMISISDNPCGEAVGDSMGWAQTDKVIHSKGFNETSVVNVNTTSSAHDVASYMEQLAHGTLFDQPTTAFIKNALANQKFRTGIPAGCQDCTVLNKTGNLDSVWHDAAIVTHGQSQYVLVVMSNRGTPAQIASLSKLVAGILK